VAVFVLAGAAIAFAAYPQDSVTVYTGCLSTSGSAGNISSVAVGSDPTKPCSSNEILIHLSGGTITKVTAGSGLTGGGDNGYVTVGLDPKYTLPQNSCAAGQFVASDGSGGWSCANDQTYTNGTGLDLNGNTFSVGSGYTLPQGCSNGQVAASNGSGGWSCHNSVGGLSTYTNSNFVSLGDNDTESTSAYCSSGDIATGGGFVTTGNAGPKASDPIFSGNSQGWHATGQVPFDFGFGSGGLTVYVKCLHVG
jgi:hypothetical protein